MIKMNIKAGLWRLWVLLTVCWVGTVTVVKFDDLTATRVGYYDPKLADKIRDPFDNSPAQIQINEAMSCKKAKNADEIFVFCDVQTLGFETITLPIWKYRIDAAQWIFIPPLGLLLLGLGIGWVVNGFRRPA